MNFYDFTPHPVNDSADLFARDARCFKAAGIHAKAIAELDRFGIRCASDALDWQPRDVARIPGVGFATLVKIAALIDMQ